MSKKNKKEDIKRPPVLSEKDEFIQNEAPIRIWSSFEEFWYSCIKGKDYFLMENCKQHLKALGWFDNQNKWLEGVKHFGIPVEKQKK